MENWEENNLEMIGAKIPREIAQKFKDYCKLKTTGSKSINQRQLFYNIAKWWLGLDETIQSLIYHGKVQEAHEQIAKEVEAVQAAIDDESVSASDSAKKKRKTHSRRPSKSA